MKLGYGKFITVAALSALVLAACSKSDDVALEAVRRDVKDPGSVVLRNVRDGVELPQGRTICGEWNAKNGFGGMGGWEGFLLPAGTTQALYVPPTGKADPDGIRALAKAACPGMSFP